MKGASLLSVSWRDKITTPIAQNSGPGLGPLAHRIQGPAEWIFEPEKVLIGIYTPWMPDICLTVGAEHAKHPKISETYRLTPSIENRG